MLVRNARELGYEMQLVSGDSIASEAFVQVTGEAGEGTVFTFFRDPRRNPGVGLSLERFRKRASSPRVTRYIATAPFRPGLRRSTKRARSRRTRSSARSGSNEFDTILGRISFDAKGDVRQPGFEWYIWRSGRYVPLE